MGGLPVDDDFERAMRGHLEHFRMAGHDLEIDGPRFVSLEVEMTIDDPKSYTAPWTVTIRQPLVLDSELLDYYCLENEKSWQHMKKPATQ